MKKTPIITLLLAGLLSCSKQSETATPMPLVKMNSKSIVAWEMYEPNVPGVSVKFSNGKDEIGFIRKGEQYTIGDMVFSQQQVEMYKNTIIKPKEARTGLLNTAELWPNGVLFYTIDPNLPDQFRVTDAINHWQSVTGITFVQRTNQSDYVTFIVGGGCSSQVGRQGGQQVITLASDCTTGNAIHEVGHALGLFHEQSRIDRDNFITIHAENIQNNDQARFQFLTYQQQGRQGFEFDALDLGSIMMYPPDAFSANGQPTITLVNGGTYQAQRNGLSGGDIDAINRMYFTTRASALYQISEDNSTAQHSDILYNVVVRFFADDQHTVPVTPTSQIAVHYTIHNVGGTGQDYNGVTNVPAGNQTYDLCQARYICNYDSNGDVSGPCYNENVVITNPSDKAYVAR